MFWNLTHAYIFIQIFISAPEFQEIITAFKKSAMKDISQPKPECLDLFFQVTKRLELFNNRNSIW